MRKSLSHLSATRLRNHGVLGNRFLYLAARILEEADFEL
jgi:hypothetical protein